MKNNKSDRYITTERSLYLEPNIGICMYFTVSGGFSDNEITLAVKKAFAASESFCCKIIMQPDGGAYYEKLDENESLNKIVFTDKPISEIIYEQERIPFRFNEGEMARVFIIRGEKTKILVYAHHLCGDGKTIVYFIGDIMTALMGGEPDYKPLKLLTPERLQKGKLPLVAGLYAKRMHRVWKKCGRAFTYDEYRKMFNSYWQTRKTVTICDFLRGDELNKMTAAAKNAGVTVNSYITTAFAKALGKNASFGYAVSSREVGDRSTGNMASGVAIKYRYNDSGSFSENTRAVHKEIHSRLSGDKNFVLRFIGALPSTLVDSLYMQMYDDYDNKVSAKLVHIMGYDDPTRDVGITNLTRLDIPSEYGKYKISDFVFVPPIIAYGGAITGIATLGGEMSIALHVPEDELEYAKKLLNSTMELLKAAE